MSVVSITSRGGLGASCQVSIDGVPLTGCRKFALTADVDSIVLASFETIVSKPLDITIKAAINPTFVVTDDFDLLVEPQTDGSTRYRAVRVRTVDESRTA